MGAFLSFITVIFFIKLTDRVFDRELVLFDNTVMILFYQLRNPTLTNVMKFFSFIGMDALFFTSAFIPLFFYWKKRKREAILFTIMILLGTAANNILKLAMHRPRPALAPLIFEHTYSFPSGHSMNSFIFFMTLAYFYYHFTHKKKVSLIAFAVSAVMVFCIGISRIYLGVHYPSDVIGGYLAGLLWLLIVLLVDKAISFFQVLNYLLRSYS